MSPRYGEPIRRDRHYHPRPGAYVVASCGGSVLLTWQCAPRRGYQLPGGGLDEGEGPIRAAHREVIEETGWRIASLRKLAIVRRFTEMTGSDHWAEKICHVYLARAVRRLQAPSDRDHQAMLVPWRRAFALLDEPGEAELLAHALSMSFLLRRQVGPR